MKTYGANNGGIFGHKYANLSDFYEFIPKL